jgi:hypothetical protein
MALGALLLSVASAPAQTPDWTTGGELIAKLQGELTAPNRAKARVGLYSDAELVAYLGFRDWFSLHTNIKLERTRNTNLANYYPDRNTAFRSQALTLRQLYATIRPVEGLAIYAGKIHPAFGSAWGPSMPGTFYNFGTDYEQDERIGGGIAYTFPESLGVPNLRLSVEGGYLDTSALSYTVPRGPSLFDTTASRPWRYARSQFGPANTGGLHSVVAALRGGKPGEGLLWQVSASHQATADRSAVAEHGQSIGASYDPTGKGIALTEDIGLTPFVEYAHFTGFAGVRGLQRHYLLGGLAFTQGDWTLSLAGGGRRSLGTMRGTDHQQNITLTYEILPRLQIGAGINHVTLAGRGSWTLAPALSYAVRF